MMYVRDPLSLRNVEDLLFERDIDNDARPPWQSGGQSWPEGHLGLAHCAQMETSRRWTDSTSVRPHSTGGRANQLRAKAATPAARTTGVIAPNT